jgi:hypothetical protein
VLKFARLGRLGGGEEQRFSFVHRRFNEYFVVQRLKEMPHRVPKDDIPTDSRWRDALVLYCEIASEKKAREIARFCWSEIVEVAFARLDMRHPQYLRATHCLRFLKDALRSRLECIEDFRDDLAILIRSQIQNTHSLLAQKLAVEAVGLLRIDDIDGILQEALELNNAWIGETAFRSCHYVSHLTSKLRAELMAFLDAIDPLTFLRRRRDITFSLRLSNIFRPLVWFCLARTAYFGVAAITVALVVISNPLLGLLWIAFLPIIGYFLPTLLGAFLELIMKTQANLASLARITRLVFLFESDTPLPLILGTTIVVLNRFPLGISLALSISMYGRMQAALTEGLQYRCLVMNANSFYSALVLVIPWYLLLYLPADRSISRTLWDGLQKAASVTTFVLAKVVKGLAAFWPWLVRLRGASLKRAVVFAGEVFVTFLKRVRPKSAKLWSSLLSLSLLTFVLVAARREELVVIGLGVLAILGVLYLVCRHLSQRLGDYRLIRTVPFGTRQEISEVFYRLKTKQGRTRFVRYIENQGIRPEGLWPAGSIPNVGNDDGSTLLAQLEEKWLGLDR